MIDYYYLCCNCGVISLANTFAALKYADDGDELIPCEPGDYDPFLRCPACKWLHTDDDSNPGIEDGTLATVTAARLRYLSDQHWVEAWSEVSG